MTPLFSALLLFALMLALMQRWLVRLVPAQAHALWASWALPGSATPSVPLPFPRNWRPDTPLRGDFIAAGEPRGDWLVVRSQMRCAARGGKAHCPGIEPARELRLHQCHITITNRLEVHLLTESNFNF